MKKTILLATMLSACVVSTAQAGVISNSGRGFVTHSYTVDNQRTNWQENILFPKFDSSLGYLFRVTFDLLGNIESNIKASNPAGDIQDVTATASAIFNISNPYTSDMSLSASDSRTAQVNGNTFDFGTISASQSNVFEISWGHPSLFSFVGSDSFNVNLRATATSSVSGSGNLLSEVGSMAGARLKVNYYFEGPAQVSAPASGALMLLGVGLIGWLRRKTQ